MDPIVVKGLVKTLLLPPAGPLLLAIAGALLAARGTGRRTHDAGRGLRRAGGAMLVVGLAALWIAAMPATADALFDALESGQRPLSVADLDAARAAPRPPGALVVLGAGARRDGRHEPAVHRPVARMLERTLAGARLARASGLPVLVTGGRPPGVGDSEATLMARVLRDDLGVEVRWLEDAALDTDDNARRSAALLARDGVDSVVLVTHAFHMGRARRAFERAGLAVLPAPHGFGADVAQGGPLRWLPSAGALEATRTALHEWLGLAWYALRGHA